MKFLTLLLFFKLNTVLATEIINVEPKQILKADYDLVLVESEFKYYNKTPSIWGLTNKIDVQLAGKKTTFTSWQTTSEYYHGLHEEGYTFADMVEDVRTGKIYRMLEPAKIVTAHWAEFQKYIFWYSNYNYWYRWHEERQRHSVNFSRTVEYKIVCYRSNSLRLYVDGDKLSNISVQYEVVSCK